ncbi:MAG: cyclic nucleotide-binding domain-containing protein [Anaerolineae bacterium]|nr:cyclic nucleotide-binding domain-containing protein [Anaerolineae bacterium]MDW8097910.1 cyclic nucleotide-binding domain-containing protein [Anaerolineae bacterium]
MEANQVLALLQNAPLLQGLPKELLQQIAAKAQRREVIGPIFYQGDMGETAIGLFLVAEGQVLEWRTDENGQEVFRRIVSKGQAFGFRSVLEDGVQLSNAQALEPSLLLWLPATDLIRLQARYPALRERLLRTAAVRRLRAMPLLSILTDEQLRWIVDLFEQREVGPDQQILSAGEAEPALCLIDRGQAIARIGEAGEVVLAAGHYFGGHQALGSRRVSSARARVLTSLYCMRTSDFEWFLTAFPIVRRVLTRPPDIVQRLRNTELFRSLRDEELRALSGYVCWVHYPAHREVTRQGEPGNAFYILDAGEAIVRVTDERRQERPTDFLTPGAAFGETSLILQEPRDATVEAVIPTNWLVLYHDDFEHFLREHPEARERLRLSPTVQVKLRQPIAVSAQREEVVVYSSRRHWWLLVRRIAILVLLWLALFALAYYGLGQHIRPILEESILALTIFILGCIAWVAIDWSNDWLIVTTRRVIHQERVILTSESRFEAPLEKIQDIHVRRRWLGQLLGYGTITVQTAATVGRLEFDYLPDPETAKQHIFEQMTRRLAGVQATSRERIRRELEEHLELGILPAPPQATLTVWPATSASGTTSRRSSLRFRLFPFREEEGDRITWRKHWLNLLLRTGWPLLFTIAVPAVAVLVWQSWGDLRAQGVETASAVFLFSLLELASVLWLLWQYADWRNDVYIVTSDRIIDIEKKPLFFSEERREASLGMVQNVNSHIPHLLAFVLGYGDVTIQTAAEVGAFRFVFVPNPREVHAEISRRLDAFRASQATQEEERRKSELAEWFQTYHRLQRNHK